MAELTRRYVVMAMATASPFDLSDPDGVFVLKPWKDPAALRALRTYCENCYPELARDLEAWIRAVERGPTVRGDVGRRNEPHVRATGSAHSSHGTKRAGRRHPTVRETARRNGAAARRPTRKRKKRGR